MLKTYCSIEENTMRFPLRTRLQALVNPSRAPSTFHKSLEIAIVNAERFVAEQNSSPERIREWQDFVTTRVLIEHGHNTAVANAVKGITFSVAASAIIAEHQRLEKIRVVRDHTISAREDPVGYLLGAEGQRCIAMALLQLHPEDRALFTNPDHEEIRACIVGAKSVARVAVGLSSHGVCYLSTPKEDTHLKVDLLFEDYESFGACLQVKTGKPSVQLCGTNPGVKVRSRFLIGVEEFNRTYGLKWAPILVSVSSRDFDPVTIENAKIRSIGFRINQILHPLQKE